MNPKDLFIDWLREKILRNPQEPPPDSWEEISNSLDLEESWERIGEELELNAIWEKVDTRLAAYESLEKIEKWTNRLSAAAVALFFCGLILHHPLLESPAFKQELKPEEHTYGQKPQSLKESLNPLEIEVSDFNFTDSTISYKKESSDMALSFVRESKEEVDVFQGQNEGLMFGPVELKPEGKAGVRKGIKEQEGRLPHAAKMGYLMELPASQVSDSVKQVERVPEEERMKKHLQYPALYAGAGAALKMSWFMNNKTSYALERNSLLTAAPSYQNDYYFTLGSRLGSRLLLQTDFYWQDKVGQVYQEYRNGHFGRVKDELRYRSAALSVSWLKRSLSYGRHSHFSRLVAGIYGGRLLKAEERFETVKLNKSPEYARYHMGLIAGYEYDSFLTDRLIFTYGMRGRLDLLNVYSGTAYMPASFGKTQTVSLDLTVSLKYILKK